VRLRRRLFGWNVRFTVVSPFRVSGRHVLSLSERLGLGAARLCSATDRVRRVEPLVHTLIQLAVSCSSVSS
jgi:hypothetical protein